MEVTHRLFTKGPQQQIPAMNKVKSILNEANFSGIVFPFSKGYAAWETDEVSTGQGFAKKKKHLFVYEIFTFQPFRKHEVAEIPILRHF